MLEKVSSLTDDEISRLKDTHGVVLFHMDGCGHCVNMMPAWNRVMTDLKDDMKNEIILGAIERSNMEKFHQHGIKPKVNGFPTVLYFHPSKLHSPEVYNKDRSYEEFKKWIMEKSRKGKGKGKTGNNVDNKVLSEIKNYDKHMKRVRERFIGNSNEIIMGQEGGGRHRHRHRRRSERSRRNRLRRTRKHRRTHSRRARSKSCSKLDVKSGGGGGCGCGKLW
jgi:hypothetical protein